MSVLAFADLPAARAPAEVVGRGRDDVAMLVATRSDGCTQDARFGELPVFLAEGDLLVINTSATLPAALPARLNGAEVHVHLSTELAEGRWAVELRTAELAPLSPAPIGASLELGDGGRLTLLAPYRGSDRLTQAEIAVPGGTTAFLARHAAAVRYGSGSTRWPLDAYQTVFARDPGSAEMPSAGRPFTTELVTELITRGVLFAPITLHAGVSSLERGESPYPERYRVPTQTARLVNAAHAWGGRVLAVGTTVVRAIETVAAADGTISSGRGWTNLLVTPARGLKAVDGLLTGWHEPESSHVLMLEAAAGRGLLEHSYIRAAELGYLGHEFGDAHLILP